MRVCVCARVCQEVATDASAQVCADNCVSALVKLLSYRSAELAAGGIDTKVVLQGVLTALPLRSDEDEARAVHAWVMDGLKPGGAIAALLPPQLIGQLVQSIVGARPPPLPVCERV